MDNKKKENLGFSTPTSTLGGSTTIPTDDTSEQSEQALDYQEYMEQRHKDAGRRVNQTIVAEKQSKPNWRDQLAEYKEHMPTPAEQATERRIEEMKAKARERVEAGTDARAENAAIYDRWAEQIVANRDAYYVAGQKHWLASRDGKHQSDPTDPIVNSFIAQFKQSETWQRTRRHNPSASIRPIESGVRATVKARMQDVEFTPEQQHALKFQALQEFIDEGHGFANDGWVEHGIMVGSDSGKLSESYTIFGREVLEHEGFIRDKQEWNELREAVEQTCVQDARFKEAEKIIREYRHDYDTREDIVIDTHSPFGYEELFEVKVTPEILLKDNESARTQIAKMPVGREYYYPDGDSRGWSGLGGNISGIHKNEDWSDLWPQIKADRVEGFTEEISRKVFLGCNVRGAKRRGEIKSLISSIIEEGSLSEEHLKAESFKGIVQRPVYSDDETVYFFKPQTWAARNALHHLPNDSYFVRGIGKILEYARRERANIFLKSVEKERIASTANLDEAQASLEEYVNLLSKSPETIDELWGLGQEDRNDPMLQKCLPNQIKEELARRQAEEDQRVEQKRRHREEVERQRQEERARRAQEAEQRRLEAERRRQEEERKRIAEEKLRQEQEQLQKELERLQKIEDFPGEIEDGVGHHEQWVNGHLNTYVKFTNPSNPPEGFEMTNEKKEALRESSYLGLFNILLSDGRIGPGREIKAKDREAAANEYFEAFNYGEHMDELNDWLTAKVEELHDNGEDDRAKLLKRRFSQWGKNEAVASAFQEYSDLVATRQYREEQDPRGDNLQVWHDTSISDVLDKFDSVYGGRDDIYLGNRFRKAHGVGVRGEGEMSSESNFMPRDVARERINALRQWGDFIKENIPDADVEEALMVFDSKHDTLADAMNHLDGNTYSVISFNYAGKRCMIAECLGFNMSGASAGAMKIWMGELGDRRGWETAFNRSKTEAAVRGDCESINHTNIVDEVINRETDSDDYIVGSEDVMFKLAFRYFESDGTNKDILRNNATNRQQLTDFIGPQMWRPNAEI